MKGIKLFGAVAILSVTLSACAATVLMKPLAMPPSGYEAVRFKQFVTVGDHAVNTYAFTAGTVLVQDRQMDGTPFYCGLHSINGASLESCFVFEGDTMLVGYGTMKQVRRDLTGKIEHIRVNPAEQK